MPLVYCFLSTTDWDAPQFGSRQQIASELARRGHRVLFVEVPRSIQSFVTDPEGTRRALRRLGRLRAIGEPAAEDRLVAYIPPLVLPLYYNPVTNRVNQALLRRMIRRALGKLGWSVDILWSYWPNAARLVGALGERVAVYHCIDDFGAVGYPLTRRSWIADMEDELCRRVDIVFTRTHALATARASSNPNTHVIAGGVDITRFDPYLGQRLHEGVGSLPPPRVGFLGTVDDRLDVDLVARCARELPGSSFVLVGPTKRHRVSLAALEGLPNVRLYPPCAPEDAPGVIAACDVCLIPYRVNAYTRALSPIKLYEYLAMGKPVVATDLPYLRREREHVILAETEDAFVEGVRLALDQPGSVRDVAMRRRVALSHSWSSQVDEIERLLAPLLGYPR